MLSDDWTDDDTSAARAALARVFPANRGMGVWTAAAKTDRDWAGTDAGLSSPDTRVQFKNNAEYHGMEVHAWQYFASAMYADARDHFYAAALWRETDAEVLLDYNPEMTIDSGHLKAIELCIRLGRYAGSLSRAQERGGQFEPPENFGLTGSWVDAREERAQAQLDAFHG